MKSKNIVIIIAIVVLLILAQIIFGRKKQPSEPSAKPAVSTARADAGASGGVAGAGPSAGIAEEQVPQPGEVAHIALSRAGGEPVVTLARGESGWTLGGAAEIPAEDAKVERLLEDLLRSPRIPLASHPLPAEAVTGLEDGNGIVVAVTDREGRMYAPRIGLRPEGVYDRTLARLPDGKEVLLGADIRGDLGLWQNNPDATPDDSAWIERRVFRFDPAAAVRVEARYPDHEMAFKRGDDGTWSADGYVPGGVWSREGLAAWLADLAELRVEGPGEDGDRNFIFTARPGTVTLTVTMADGTEKGIRVGPDSYEGGMLAVVSDLPAQVYRLPQWRMERHFFPLRRLFPGVAPTFDIADIRFIDIRRGVESVKIAHRDGVWRPIGARFPLRQENVEFLARLLASLKPQDYATHDLRRAAYGAPMVEVTLSGDEVHQYRLAGRHPVFPWRYVVLGSETLSVTDAEATVMFPGFADVLDLGLVFPDQEEADIAGVILDDAHGQRIVGFSQDAAGGWTADTGRKARTLTTEESAKVIRGLLNWNVAGFFDAQRDAGQHPIEYLLKMIDGNGREKTIELLKPRERDIPFVSGGDRGYLVDRADFSNWLGDVREVARELDEAAEQEAAALREQRAREEAEREAAQKAAAAELETREMGSLPVEPVDASPVDDGSAAPMEEAERTATGNDVPDASEPAPAGEDTETLSPPSAAPGQEGEGPFSEPEADSAPLPAAETAINASDALLEAGSAGQEISAEADAETIEPPAEEPAPITTDETVAGEGVGDSSEMVLTDADLVGGEAEGSGGENQEPEWEPSLPVDY